jgi:hypothetical protein
MVAWSCEDCVARPGLLDARGRCGGAFTPDLPRSHVDHEGRYVEGADIMSASTGTFRRLRFHSCPVAVDVSEALQLFRRAGDGGERLPLLLDRPSAQAWDAVEVLGAEVVAIRRLQDEIRRRQRGTA